MSRAFFHVGPAGFDQLGEVLWRGRDTARDQGLLLPGDTAVDQYRALMELREKPHRTDDPQRAVRAWPRLVDAVADWHGDLLFTDQQLCPLPTGHARRAAAALAAQGREIHVVLTAQDLGRQLPAEWQRRVRDRQTLTFAEFLDEAAESDEAFAPEVRRRLDTLRLASAWSRVADPVRLHLVTVPPGPIERAVPELWRRFARVLGLDPSAFGTDLGQETLGAETTELLRRFNAALGGRLAADHTYALGARRFISELTQFPRTELRLGGGDLEFARRHADRIVAGLARRDLEVVGDLEELRVGEPPRPGEQSTPRTVTPDEGLLPEPLTATADRLHDAVHAELGHEVTRRAARAGRRGIAPGGRRRVLMLMWNVGGHDGVARTAINLANGLADRYEVIIGSLFTRGQGLTFEVDPRVRVEYITGRTPQSWRDVKPGVMSDVTRNLHTWLAAYGPDDVAITSRPLVHVMAGVDTVTTGTPVIAWDHLNFPVRYSIPGGGYIDEAMEDLAALVPLTALDAADYRARFPRARVRNIPNSVTWEPVPARTPRGTKTVVAAGRLVDQKGFERLIAAWGLLAAEFPDWECKIYGEGPQGADLQRQIDELGVRVELAGYNTDMPGTLQRSELLASSSRYEGFPMAMIEAMSQGNPLVAFDCPRGPGEIIDDGHNGRLVPEGDVEGLAAALADVMRDDDRRERMGQQALIDARSYSIGAVVDRWAELIEEVAAER